MRRFSLMALAQITAVFLSAPAPTFAQSSSMADYDERLEQVIKEDSARQIANMSKSMYDSGDWAEALKWARSGCDSSQPVACDILGRVLAEGRTGPTNPGGALAAHRKAAALYATSCGTDGNAPFTCLQASDFLRVYAVQAVRNEALARTYAIRARDIYARNCLSAGNGCSEAGLLAMGEFTGKPDPAQAVQYWRRGCESSSKSERPASCNGLVGVLAEGPEHLRNYPEARRRISADQCNVAVPQAGQSLNFDRLYCSVLAELLLDGLGGPADPKTGERLLRSACAKGQKSACTSLESRGLGIDDMKAAFALNELGLQYDARQVFETQCTANNGLACTEAARRYNQEPGETDKAKARQLFARSCTLGNTIGCYNSGNSLRNLGGEANFVAARAALRKACDAKDAPACRLLGAMFGRGEGGPRDPAEASRLYGLACAGRDSTACLNLGTNYINGTGVAADPIRARSLHEQACNLGSQAGCTALAEAMMLGRGGARDDVRARALFQRACDSNIANACGNLGTLWRDGLGGGADHAKARTLFNKGCELRNANACVDYSDSLLSSRGGPTDQAKAISMRRFACLGLDQAAACQWLREGGHSNPLEEGAILLNTGKKDRALPLLRQACDAGKSEGCLAYGANMAVTDNARRAEQTAYFRKACNLGEKRACDLLPK